MNQLIEDLRAARAEAAVNWGQGQWLPSEPANGACQCLACINLRLDCAVCLVGSALFARGHRHFKLAASDLITNPTNDARFADMIRALYSGLPCATTKEDLASDYYPCSEACMLQWLSSFSEVRGRAKEDIIDLFDLVIEAEEAKLALVVVVAEVPVLEEAVA